ncbi:uncharacterized protein LOC144075105 isoform X2 [Stigmatopora argus]
MCKAQGVGNTERPPLYLLKMLKRLLHTWLTLTSSLFIPLMVRNIRGRQRTVGALYVCWPSQLQTDEISCSLEALQALCKEKPTRFESTLAASVLMLTPLAMSGGVQLSLRAAEHLAVINPGFSRPTCHLTTITPQLISLSISPQ